MPASVSTAPFSRNGTANYTDVNGIVQVALANVLRNQHYVGGALQPPLIEPASTNVLWPSRNFTTNWSQSFAINPTMDAVGLDGILGSGCTLHDADAGNFSSMSRSVAIANDKATHVQSVWIWKDADQTRFPQVKFILQGGTSLIQRAVAIDTKVGTPSLHNFAGQGTFRVIDAGLWWILEITCTNNATGNTTATCSIYAAAGTTLGLDSPAGVGTCIIGHAQIELNANAYSSPIYTTVAPVQRAADVDQMLAAMVNGYTRQNGDFIQDGFARGMQLTPVGFASNPSSIITNVFPKSLLVSDLRNPEAISGGRSLSDTPALTRGSGIYGTSRDTLDLSAFPQNIPGSINVP